MTFMGVLKKSDGSDIHADILWAYRTANKNKDTRMRRDELHKADALLQKEVEENDKLQNVFRMGFRSSPIGDVNRRGVEYRDVVSIEKDKSKFINRADNLIKSMTFNMDNMIILNVLNKLKEALGVRTDQSVRFATNMRTLLETWAKYGNNAKAKNLINEMRKNLASSAKLLQRYLLEGKGKLKSDVARLFISPNATFDDGWSEVREYNGKSSIDIMMDIYQVARIPIRRTGEIEAGIKEVSMYYSLDIDRLVDDITKLIQTKSADPAEHYTLFFNSDNILRMIYRLIPDIIYTTNEDMSESEMKAELEKQFDALEYLLRINTLTGDYSRLKESRLKKVKRLSTKYRGTPLRINRDFPNLETAWELYEEDPKKYAPEAVKRRQKAPKQVKPQRIGIRSDFNLTYPPKKEREEKIESLEDKINAYSRKIEEVKPALTSGQLAEKDRLTMVRTMNTFKELLSEIEEEDEDIDEEIEEYKNLIENFDMDRYYTNDQTGESVSAEEVKETYVEYLKTLEEDKKTMERLPKQIKILERVLSNLPKRQQSLDEPSSEDTKEESA